MSVPWILSSVGVVVDGITIPNTFSLPTASVAKYAVNVESIPPLNPTTSPFALASDTLSWMNLIMLSFVVLVSNFGSSFMLLHSLENF